MRIFFIHGVSTRRALGDLYEGLDASSSADDGMERKYHRELDEMVTRLTDAAKKANLGEPSFVPIYWGDQGARFHWYERDASSGKLQPLVQPGVGLFRLQRSAKGNAQGLGRPHPEPHEEEILESLDLLASQSARDVTSLRDLLLREPLATLHILFDPVARHESLTETEVESLDAKIASVADRLVKDEGLRSSFLAIDASKPDADAAVIRRLRELLEGSSHAMGGFWGTLFGPVLGAFTRVIVYRAKSPGVYLHWGRFFGDSVRYFSSRGTRESPGQVIETVRDQIAKGLRDHPSDSPTVFITHSLGSALFYDLFTYFDPALSFDLWISVGSQLGYYEDAKLLARSRNDDGGFYGRPIEQLPSKVRVPLPAGAKWFDVRDPRDPIGFAAAPVFEGVVDKPCVTGNHNFFEIHNAYFTDPRFFGKLVEIFETTFSKAGSERASATPRGS